MSANFNDYRTVQVWLQGVHEQSGVSPEADTKRMMKDGAVSSNQLLSMYEMLHKDTGTFHDLTGSRK